MKNGFYLLLCVLGGVLLCSCGPREQQYPPPTATQSEPLKVPPDQLRFPMVSGEGQASISDFRGKVLLVNFFGGSSEECRAEIEPLNALLSELSGKPVAFLGIALDLKPQIYVKEDLRPTPPAFPCVLGNKLARQAFPSVRAVPTKWLLDRDGKIVKKYEGAPAMLQIRADIDELTK
jgi:thiol-disulfide isomerase/thioredoxin